MKLSALRGAETTTLSLQSLGWTAPPAAPRIPAFAFGVGVAAAETAAVMAAGVLADAAFGMGRPWAELQTAAVLAAAAGAALGGARRCERDPAAARHALDRRRAALGFVLLLAAPGLLAALVLLGGEAGGVAALRWAAAFLLATGIGLWLVTAAAAAAAGMMGPMRLALIGTSAAQREALSGLALRPAPRPQVLSLLDPTAEARAAAALDQLVGAIRADQVDAVLLDPLGLRRATLDAVLARLAETPVEVRLVCRPGEAPLPGERVVTGGEVPQLRISTPPIAGWAAVLKRLEDLALALGLLVLLAPLMVLVALAVRLDSPGPILFRQPRYGRNNRVIEVLKFRTMRHAEQDVLGALQALPGDDRVTRVGRVLRHLSLDELPQLFNVLGGSMSVVGPRPHALHTRAAGILFEDAVAGYPARHNVKPGITGLAQVRGWRGPTMSVGHLERRLQADLEYISRWSLALDLRIVLATGPAMVRACNAC